MRPSGEFPLRSSPSLRYLCVASPWNLYEEGLVRAAVPVDRSTSGSWKALGYGSATLNDFILRAQRDVWSDKFSAEVPERKVRFRAHGQACPAENTATKDES